MSDEGKLAIIIISIITLSILSFFAILWVSDVSYKTGQIDYANGKILYKLTNNPNKSITWEKVK